MPGSSPPLTTLTSVILTTGPFIAIWSYLKNRVSARGPYPYARTLLTWVDRVYSIFSALFAYSILNSVLSFHPATQVPSQDLAYAYHLTKIWEYIDVVLLIAIGAPVVPHMAFHHLTTPYLTYFRVLKASQWEVFAFLNCVHHTIMYAFYGGWIQWVQPFLPVTGYAQLVLGIAWDLMWLRKHGAGSEEGTNRAICVLLLARYAMLYTQQLRDQRQAAKKAEAETETEKEDE